MVKWRILVIAFIFSLPAAGQMRYSLGHFSNKDGLPANAVKGMEWDASTGLLWIATEGGLVRWDGSNFETAAETEGSRVMQLAAVGAEKRNYFAITDNSSVLVIDGGQARPWRGSKDPVRMSRFEGDSVSLFEAGHHPHDALMPSPSFQAVPSLPNTFLVNWNQKLYLKDDAGMRLLHPAAKPWQFLKIKDRQLAYFNDSLFYFNATEKKLQPIRATGGHPKQFLVLSNDGRHMPMAYSGRSLYRLRLADGDSSWSLEPVFDGMPENAQPFLVREMDNVGMIVLADMLNGLYVLRPKYIRQLTDTTGQIESARLVTYAQGLLRDGRIVSHSGVVYDRRGPVAGLTLPVSQSTTLFPYGDYLYFGHSNSLFRFSQKTQTSEQLSYLDNSGWMVMAQTRGRLYVVGGGLLYRFSETGLDSVFDFRKATGVEKGINVNTAIDYEPGILLIGSGNELRFLDIDKKTLTSMRVSQQAPVRHLWRCSYGVYICTYGEGLYLLEKGRVYPLPRDKSGHLRFAHAIVPDGHGFCYISTNNGLFKVSEDALHQAAHSGAAVYYHFLGRDDGLEQTELNGGGLPAYLRLPDGTLSFPTMSGLAQFQPDSVRIGPPSGVILVRATADARDMDSFPAQLASQTKLIQFDVTVPFWGSSENLYAWYRLRRKGEAASDTQWIAFDPARQRYFNFTSLKSDRYSFEVRTFNGFASGNFAMRKFQFEIAPPWYASGRYLFVWILVLGTLIWLTIYLRTRQLRAQSLQLEATVLHRTQEIELQKQQLGKQLKLVSEAHDLKERLISVISHNIITPLRYIHRATTMMREDARSLDPVLREKAVDSINDTSLELELLSVNLLNWIKLQHTQVQVVPEAFTFSEIADHVRSLLGPVAKSKGQKIQVESVCDDVIFQFKDALQVILYNLVLNAITHSGGSSTALLCSIEEETFTMSVQDNGHGISEAQQKKLLGDRSARGALKETENQGKGFGFIIIRDLVTFIGGTLLFEEVQAGTKISVRFKSLSPETGAG